MQPPPVFATTPGPYEVAVAAQGTQASGGDATLTLRLTGPPVGAWLYLTGRDGSFSAGDTEVRVAITNGAGATRVITTVPIAYRTVTSVANFVSRIDITRFVSRGTNRLAISGFDLSTPEGAFAYAVFRGNAGTPEKLIQVLDGADIGYFTEPPPLGPDSEVASFRFDPSAAERRARVVLAISDAEGGRGDEVFGFTGAGRPADQLRDTDGDGRIDIVDRRVALTRTDYPPPGIEPANASGALEAHRRAFSIAEDCLGVQRVDGGCGVGPEFNVVTRRYTIPAGHEHADFQVQSEDPENGDSFLVVFALNELTLEGINPVPEIEVIKNVTPTSMPEPGGPATFEVVVNNLGGESLRLASLVDDVFGNLAGRGTCVVPRTIPMGGSYRCTFVAAVSGTAAAPHHDTVTGAGTGVISGLPVNDSDDAVVTFTRPGEPDFTLTKTASVHEGYPRDLVTYTFVVENTGSVRLENLTVTDDKLGPIGTVTLDPGQSATLYKTNYELPTCTGTDLTVVTLCDGATVRTGFCSLPNTATASWGQITRTASDCVDILPFGSIGDFVWEDLDKDGQQDAGEPGLEGVTVALFKDGAPFGIPAVTDAAGGYLFADLKAGAYRVDPEGVAGLVLTTANDPHDVALGIGQDYLLADFGYWKPGPDIRIVKTADPTDVLAGAAVTYTFVVTNTGNAVLVDIDVTDDKLGYIGTIPRLAPGASAPLTKTVAAPACGTGGTTDQPCAFDVTGECTPLPEYCFLHNVAVARGYEEIFRTVVSDDDDACIRIRKPVPKISVTKVADPTFGYLFAADPSSAWPYALISTPLAVSYTAAVTNPGEEPLLNLAVVDNPASLEFAYQSGDANRDGALDLTETWLYTATWTYTVAGKYPDTVTASGTGVFSGIRVSAQASAVVKAVGCGQCLGKVSTLTLRWNGAADASIRVVAENDKFSNPVAYEGTVPAGGSFSFGPLSSGLAGFNGTLGTNISLFVNGSFGATIHTSCSQAIYPGQDWGPDGALPPGQSGPFTVVGGTSKQGGLLCPIVRE